MKRIELEAKNREIGGTGAARALRRDGFTPAIIYGPDADNVPIAIDTKKLEKAIREGGSSALITLNIEGADKSEEAPLAIIKDAQYHPMGMPLLHVDFYKVTYGQELQVSVPIALVGEPIGVQEGGSVDQAVREANISCTPRKIPDQIEVDISHLDLGDAISFGDIEAPEGVTILHADDVNIASVKITRIALSITTEEGVEGEEVEGEEGEVAEGEEAPVEEGETETVEGTEEG